MFLLKFEEPRVSIHNLGIYVNGSRQLLCLAVAVYRLPMGSHRPTFSITVALLPLLTALS